MTKEWATEDDTTCPDPLRPRPTQDSRGYSMLPQAPMDAGYYVYGLLYKKPAKGVRTSEHDDGDPSRRAGVAGHRQTPLRSRRHQPARCPPDWRWM
jgi:hypothetical protein